MKKLVLILIFFCQQAFAQTTVTPELLWKLGRVHSPQVSPDGQEVIFGVKTYNLAANKGVNTLYKVPIAGGEPQALTTSDYSAFSAQWKPNGKINYLSTEGGSVQVWEMNADGSNKTKVSTIENGIETYKFSPDGQTLLFSMRMRMEPSLTETYPDLPQSKARLIDGLMYRHWTQWHDYSYSHLFVGPVENGKVQTFSRDLMQGQFFDTPTRPFGGDEEYNWSPDGKTVVYTCKKLTGTDYAVSTNTDIYAVNAIDNTGTESNYSAPNAGYDRNPAFAPNGSLLAWQSMEEDGYESDKNRLMVRDMKTNTITDLSKDFEHNVDQFIWGPNSENIYFISGVAGTRQIFVVNLKGKVRQITEGMHDYTALAIGKAKKSTILIGSKRSMSMPSELFVIDPKKGTERQLTFTNKSIWEPVKKGNVEKRMIKTTDGKDMLTWVIYPPDFDPKKKYPTLLYCQGGPQAMVSQFFSYRWNFQLMAANGYIIVAPNRRGLPGFGQEWNDAIVGDYGGQCMKDYLSAIDAVAEEPFVDKDRLGAVGASFGGFSVYWLAGNHNGRFKTFISHCGMYNMESWYGSTEEMFFANKDNEGPYWQNPMPNNFKASPHKFVQNWDSPILIIHNEKDFRVPLNQGLEAFTAAQLKNIPSKFLYFPDEGHWVLKPQNGVVWHRVYFEWLDQWLK